MVYLLLRPDYSILGKYVQFPCSPTEMNEQNPKGFAISMDWFYTDEHYINLEKDFKAVLSNFNLLDHYDNLMFISLTELQTIESTMMVVNSNNRYRKGLKQLSQLLIAFQEDKDISLVVKPALNPSFKVSENNLVRWIGMVIKETIEKGDYKFTDLGFEVEALFSSTTAQRTICVDKLSSASQIKLYDPSKQEKRLIAQLCFFSILPYLNGETHLNYLYL